MATANSAKAFLGVGWAFPPCLTKAGSTATAAYEKDVYEAIWIILSTDWGERVMRPDFGAGLRSFVFRPVSETARQQIQARIQESLVKWEPRINVEEVVVAYNSTQPGKLLISITYTIRVTNTLQNLVYPFFLQEGAGP